MDNFANALQAALNVSEINGAFLRTARYVLPALNSGFYRLDASTVEPGWVVADVPDDFLLEYERIGRSDDPVLHYVMERGCAIDSSRLPDSHDWEHAGVRSVLASVGFHHSMQAPVVASGRLLGTINFARSRHEVAFSATDLRIARRMAEQLGLAIERAERHEEVCRRATMFEQALDRAPQAIAISSLAGDLVFVNRAAMRLNDSDVRTISRIKEGPIAAAMAAFRSHNSRLVTESVNDGEESRIIVKAVRLAGVTDTAVNFIYRSARAELARLPGWDVLSRREQEIAQLVSEGLTTRQIAERAYISENTVKQHLKRMFAKTNSRNRAELLQQAWAATAGTTD